MDDETAFYTQTMANVYAQQGHFEKAVKIYQHLLTSSPEDQALKAALKTVQSKLSDDNGEDRLKALFAKWIMLANQYRIIRDVQRLKKDLTQ